MDKSAKAVEKVVVVAQINEEKYQNVILYLCSKLRDNKVWGKVKLAKLLYYVDFDRFEYDESMVTVTGDVYKRLPHGPFPESFEKVAKDLEELGKLSISEKEWSSDKKAVVIYEALKEADESVFSPEELFILDRVVTLYGNLSGAELEAKSHREAPWLGVEHCDEIPFELAFYRGTDFSDAMRAA